MDDHYNLAYQRRLARALAKLSGEPTYPPKMSKLQRRQRKARLKSMTAVFLPTPPRSTMPRKERYRAAARWWNQTPTQRRQYRRMVKLWSEALWADIGRGRVLPMGQSPVEAIRQKQEVALRSMVGPSPLTFKPGPNPQNPLAGGVLTSTVVETSCPPTVTLGVAETPPDLPFETETLSVRMFQSPHPTGKLSAGAILDLTPPK
jgi:hypothetical protein